MKFRVERDVLADAVAWAARSLPVRPSVPVLAGLYLGRVGRHEAFGAMAGGVTVTLLFELTTGPAGAWGIAPVLWGLGASALALGLLSWRRVSATSAPR